MTRTRSRTDKDQQQQQQPPQASGSTPEQWIGGTGEGHTSNAVGGPSGGHSYGRGEWVVVVQLWQRWWVWHNYGRCVGVNDSELTGTSRYNQ